MTVHVRELPGSVVCAAISDRPEEEDAAYYRRVEAVFNEVERKTKQHAAQARFQAHLDYLDGLIGGLKELDCHHGKAADEPKRPPPTPRRADDDLREWRATDRAAWAEFRKWEDKWFPINAANPFKDPPGMVAARRAFEREQEISKAKEILRLREVSSV
jgi:hypothetical protein